MVNRDLLREKCREVLERSKVEGIIGHKRKRGGPRGTIAIFREEAELRDMVFSPLSTNNPVPVLYNRLQREEGVLGVVLKGCDARSLIQLIQENMVDPERIRQIGVSCPGVVNYERLMGGLRGEGLSNKEIIRIRDITLAPDEEEVLVEGENGAQLKLSFGDLIDNNCSVCDHPTPKKTDFLIGEERPGRGSDFVEIIEVEGLAAEERWEYWRKEFDKCIRCFACRAACPICYCRECITDPDELAISRETLPKEKARRPKWLGKIVGVPENAFFHLVKAMHHAGRCVDCGECERACPMDIPVRKLERKLILEVRDLFDCEAGIDPEEPSFEATAKPSELEDVEMR